VRAFVAVEVPELSPLPGLPSAPPGAPRHFTLRFLGEIEPAEAASVDEALQAVAPSVPSFPLTLSGIGAFPDWSRPRIVYVKASEGAVPLEALAGRVGSALEARGFPKEARAFTPHVTLLRVRGRSDLERAHRIAEAAGERPLAETRVTEMVLKSSELAPSGARHRTIGTYRLADGP
jgi:RNA 2',3'-cyclic 3'-phosphodiesterase